MIRHISGIAEIVEDVDAAVRFYRGELGLEVDFKEGEPYAVVHVPGVIHFGLWDRAFAAERVFGDGARGRDVPQGFMLGFEVDDPSEDAGRLRAGASVLQPLQEEPWGQETVRFLTPGGALCELTRTPWARKLVGHPAAAPDDSNG